MQGAHTPPPQSTSVSRPSLRPSWHWFATQVLGVVKMLQALDEQSPFATQPFPTAHAEHWPPPQSMSVSKPSFC
jgi:hypothetical protein